jgi:group II intron reverse transcriptase/maturase
MVPCGLDSILTLDSLEWAWLRVRRNQGAAGADGITADRFARSLEANLLTLAEEVNAWNYIPGPVRFVMVQKPGKLRRLAILTIRDRVLQRAVLDHLVPIVEPSFLPCSFGYRPGRSIQDAVERIVHLRNRGMTEVIDADIRNCFDNLDHALLMEFVRRQAPDIDPRVFALIRQWIAMPERPRLHRKDRPRQIGILQGAPLSPLLCNIYLHKMDASLRRRLLVSVRYADDFVVFCRSPEHAEHGMREVQKILNGIRLSLHPGKTRLADFDRGFDFLGVHFEGDSYSYVTEGRTVTVESLPPEWFHYHADGYD